MSQSVTKILGDPEDLPAEGRVGKFTGIPSEAYHGSALSWAYSSSDLREALISPSNLLQKRGGKRKETAALKFGRAVHTRFEHFDDQDAYLQLVAVPPKCDRRTLEGKKLFADFEATCGSKTILDEKEWDQVEGMLQAVKDHPDARLLLEAEGVNEETFIWQDEASGVLCKCRPDKRILVAPQGMQSNIILDWKTTESGSVRDIQSSIAEYQYHMQAAFYLDGISKVLGQEVGPFVNVFIQKGGSNRVVLGVLDEHSLSRGRALYQAALVRIAECRRTGNWWGFVDLSLPAWAA